MNFSILINVIDLKLVSQVSYVAHVKFIYMVQLSPEIYHSTTTFPLIWNKKLNPHLYQHKTIIRTKFSTKFYPQ